MRLIGEILIFPVIIAAIIAMLLVPAEIYIGYLHNKKEYKAARQEIENDIRVWKSIAKSCDDIKEAYEKGYAIARLVIYHHRLDMLDEYYEKTGLSSQLD